MKLPHIIAGRAQIDAWHVSYQFLVRFVLLHCIFPALVARIAEFLLQLIPGARCLRLVLLLYQICETEPLLGTNRPHPHPHLPPSLRHHLCQEGRRTIAALKPWMQTLSQSFIREISLLSLALSNRLRGSSIARASHWSGQSERRPDSSKIRGTRAIVLLLLLFLGVKVRLLLGPSLLRSWWG